MPNKIFLLPDEGALVAERIDDESSFVREPVTRARYVARLVEAIPDDWSDVSGLLDSADPDADRDTGYEFHRHGSGARIVSRVDLVLVVSGRTRSVASAWVRLLACGENDEAAE